MRSLAGFSYIIASAISLLALLLAAEQSAEASTNFCTNLYNSQVQVNEKSRSFNEIVNGIKKVISPELSPQDFKISGGELNSLDLQFLKMNLSAHIHKLIRGDELQVLQPEDIPPFITYHYGVMKFFEMNTEESSQMKSLMSDAYLAKKPITKIYLKAHLNNGRDLELPYKIKSISSEDDLLAAEAQFYNDMYKQFGSLKNVVDIEVTIFQSHYDVIVRRPELLKVFRSINRISEEEVAVVENWAQRLPSGKKIYVKKMVPNGYYYLWSTKTGLR